MPSNSFLFTNIISLIHHSYVSIDRKKQYTENDWRVKHAQPLAQWEQRQRMHPESGPAHRHNHYKEYLRWLHSVARVSVKPPQSTEPIEDKADTDDVMTSSMSTMRSLVEEFSPNGALCRITWYITLFV